MTEESYQVIRNSFSLEIPDEQLRDSTHRSYSAQVREEILELSKQRKYTPFIAKHLVSLGIDEPFWSEQYRFYQDRNERILAFIIDLFEVFYHQGIQTVFAYENFGGLLSSGSNLALYSSGDVDLCADKSEFDQINDVMLKRGFELKQASDSQHQIFRVAYQGKIGDMDYRINLMFKPLVRYRMPVGVNAELTDAENMRFYRDTHIRIPKQEVLLYLNMMRISVHGYVRSPDMRLYVDVYNCSRGQVDWQQVVSWAKQDGNLNRIIAVAYTANCLFGTSVPRWLLNMKDDKSLKAASLIRIICDESKKRLKTSPGRMERQLMEYYSDGCGFVRGILYSIFPQKKWLIEYYGSAEKGLLYAYGRYLKFVVKGMSS